MATVKLTKAGGRFDALELKIDKERINLAVGQEYELSADVVNQFKKAFPDAEFETVTVASKKDVKPETANQAKE